MLDKATAQNDQLPEVDKIFNPSETVINAAKKESAEVHKSTTEQVHSETQESSKKTNIFTDPATQQKSKKISLKGWHKILLIVLAILIVIASFLGVLAFYTYQVAMEIQFKSQEAKTLGSQAYQMFKSQNLPETEVQLKATQDKLQEIKQSYQKLAFYDKVPVANLYYRDGQHGLNAAEHGLNAGIKAVSTLTPYADVLGFQGEGSFTGGTAEDRIKILLTTLDKVMPEFDSITGELEAAQKEIHAIDPNRYPEKIKDQPIRQYLVMAKDTANQAVTALVDFRPVLEQLPDIAGGKGERRKYLILFQNDNELRPTGGFLTAYAVIYVENGKVSPEKSDDIYELDKKFNKKIAIPEKLGKYLTTEKYWNLRDMNTSPDFKLSMDQFFENYKTVKGEPDNIDGIIAVDTHVLTKLLEILGPVEVPGYGTFSAEIDKRCDCPQVVYALSEIITKPTPYIREDRKGILGPMMQGILQKTYTANKTQWPSLFQAGWEALEAKHVQMYFLSEKFQTAAETINAAGRVRPQENSDFLAIVNANLGGAKSNLFVTYDVKQTVSAPESGFIEKTVEITYKNSRQADNCNLEAGKLCLNSTLNDWTRLYLPKGSELIEAQGFKNQATTYEENGFTVVDGFFNLEPMGVAKLKLTYKVPYTDTKEYRLYIWKQGGIDPIKSVIDVNGGQEEITYDKDTLYQVTF
ncbi:MAG: DUF4012 domain-containing protein [Patescibacteria group bacterium]